MSNAPAGFFDHHDHLPRSNSAKPHSDLPQKLHTDHPTRKRPPRNHHPRDAPRRRPRAAPDARASPRRNRRRPHGHPRQHQPPQAQPRPHGHRPRQQNQDQRQHGRIPRQLQHRSRSRKTPLGRKVGRRHRHGPLHRRRPQRNTQGNRRKRHHPNRHRPHLFHDHRQENRRPRLAHDRGGADQPGRAGRRLLHHPRRRPQIASAVRQKPPHRHRLARRIAPRQVDDHAQPREHHVRRVGSHLPDPAEVRCHLQHRRRPPPRRPRRRHRPRPACRIRNPRRAHRGALSATASRSP